MNTLLPHFADASACLPWVLHRFNDEIIDVAYAPVPLTDKEANTKLPSRVVVATNSEQVGVHRRVLEYRGVFVLPCLCAPRLLSSPDQLV